MTTSVSQLPEQLTPGALSNISRGVFRTGPAVSLAMQHYRSYICPFHRLIPFVPEGARILDVGTGSGLFLGLLWQLGRIREGVGFDAKASAIAVAQAMAAQTRRNGAMLSFEHRAAEAPWPEGPFDVVAIIDVLHHVPVPARAGLFVQAARALRPGGTLLYKDIGTRPRWRAAASWLHDILLSGDNVSFTPVPTINAWATAAGLKLRHHESINMWWYGHELSVFDKQSLVAGR